jgi:hypothetical protein
VKETLDCHSSLGRPIVSYLNDRSFDRTVLRSHGIRDMPTLLLRYKDISNTYPLCLVSLLGDRRSGLILEQSNKTDQARLCLTIAGQHQRSIRITDISITSNRIPTGREDYFEMRIRNDRSCVGHQCSLQNDVGDVEGSYHTEVSHYSPL